MEFDFACKERDSETNSLPHNSFRTHFLLAEKIMNVVDEVEFSAVSGILGGSFELKDFFLGSPLLEITQIA